MKDIFSRIKLNDLMDEVKIDEMDTVELDAKDEVLLSEDLEEVVREEVRKEISRIPIGKIITRILQKETEKREKMTSALKLMVSNEIETTKGETKNELKSIKEKFEEFSEKLRKKFDDIKNDVMTISGKQWYQFGGFSPQFNDLNIGDPGTNGSWRIVINGSELSVQKREGGAWVEKGSFTP